MSNHKRQRPEPVPGVAQLAPYRQGKSEISGVAEPLKLSSNESLYGPSPKAIEAYRAVGRRLYEYPNGDQTELRRAIAEVHGLDADRIVCSNGSDELISLLIRALVGSGDQVVISEYAFAMAFLHAQVQGAEIVKVREPSPMLRPDVDALLDAVTDTTRMVIIASPNNPIGRYLPKDELERLHAGLRRDIVLLIDGAYADYVDAADFDSGAGLVAANENVVMTRTFSKLYGLAGLRIGWGYLSDCLLDYVQRIRTPFNANSAALAAATAAVRDTEHAAHVRASNNRELGRISAALKDLGIDVLDSFSNSYMMLFADPAKTADEACRYLEARGIIPRPVDAGGPAACLRLTVGRPADNDAVIAALDDFMKA